MERLTAKNYRSFLESYVSIYDNNELQEQEKEQENIQEFLQVIDELVEDGYDLSEYTYDELYEYYITEGVGNVLKAVGGRALKAATGAAKSAWKGTTVQTKQGSKFVPGAEQEVKAALARTARIATKVGIPAAVLLGISGEKGKEWAGYAIQKGKEAIGNIPSPEQMQNVKPKPSKKNDYLPPESLTRESVDVTNIIMNYLINENYASNEKAALKIIENMSTGWKESVLNSCLEG